MYNFSTLLLFFKINIFDFFEMGDFLQIFVISRKTEILIESNYWLGMYVPCILKEGVSLHFQQKVRFGEYFKYFLMG